MRLRCLQAFLGLLILPLHAQIFPAAQDCNQWDGRRLFTIEGLDATRLSIESRGRKGKQVINLPPTYKYLDHFNGFFRAQEFERLANGERNWKLHSSADGVHWNQEGTSPDGKRGVMRVLAVGGGQYLLIAGGGMAALVEGKASSCFALAAMDDNRVLRLRTILDMGLDEPYATLPPPSMPPAAAPPKPIVNPKYRLPLLALGSQVVRSPEAIAVVSERTGYIWILDTQKESPSMRLVKVFNKFTETRFSTPDRMETAILGIQPRSDGHFFLATRSEEAVLAGVGAGTEIRSLADAQDKALMDNRSKHQNAGLEKHPDILWWDLDPATGKLTRESAPPGLPDKITDASLMRKFRFKFKPDGSVEGFH